MNATVAPQGEFAVDERQRVLAAHKDRTATKIFHRNRESLLEDAPRQDDVSRVVLEYVP